MTLSPDQAALLRGFLLGAHGFEMGATKRVLSAIPAGQENYQADAKSFTALALAHHIVTAEIWFLQGILGGAFSPEPNVIPEGTTIPGLVAQYEAEVPALVEKVKAMDPAELAKPLDFFGMMVQPAVSYINFMNVHTIHHRGQLSASLRTMGGKVPSIYGPSADDKGGM